MSEDMDEQTALNLVQEDYDEDEYEPVVEGVDDGHFKHDITNYYSIFLRKSDMTYWKIDYNSSYNYGLDEYSISTSQVKKKEIVTTTWVPA